MANAAGTESMFGATAGSQQGRAGLRLQNALPDARVLYVSATGATTIQGLAYAVRLGLWAAGETPFESRADFVRAMEAGGVAAMEVVARDLKALSRYQARVLSFEGIEIDILRHDLTDAQRTIYDRYADAFQLIHRNIEAAPEATGITEDGVTRDPHARARAMSAFESAKQRFFGHLLTGMKCPTLIRSIEADLEEGRSAVVQLVSTGEALTERRLAEIPVAEWDDLSLDLTPREYVLDYVRHAFPVCLHETYTTADGATHSRVVTGPDDEPVLSQEALEARERLLEELAGLPPIPAALDQIVQHFGTEEVAEITGRKRRIVRVKDGDGERLAVRPRPASAGLTEAEAFLERREPAAGGVARSRQDRPSEPDPSRGRRPRVHDHPAGSAGGSLPARIDRGAAAGRPREDEPARGNQRRGETRASGAERIRWRHEGQIPRHRARHGSRKRARCRRQR